MDITKNEQYENSVSGGQARVVGGNDNSTNITTYNYGKTDIEKLFESFQIEYNERKTIENVIEELNSYIDNRDEKGLEVKLKEGNREADLEDAMELKERYNKILMKYSMYESAQKIHCFLLSYVCTKFRNYVYPLLKNGALETEIKKTISEQVVDPLMDKISHGGFSSAMMITSEDIEGMIYYLTGTCRLKWV